MSCGTPCRWCGTVRPLPCSTSVVDLQKASRGYQTDAYDGHAFVLIVDGSTGDILLDTWHNKLGNIADLGGRKALRGT